MKEQDYLDIEAYLQGELPAAAAGALEARAAADPAFAAVLAGRQLLNGHLRAAAEEPALRSNLTALSAKYFTDEDAAGGKAAMDTPNEAVVTPLLPRKRRILLISLAAAIILLLVFGGRMLFEDKAGSFEQFAQHQPLSLTERGEGDNGISAAEAAFNEGRYKEAIPPLREYLELNKEDARARLALGIAHLEKGDNDEAVRLLTEVAERGGSVAPYGNWYLALAAVRRDDKAAARRYLDRIPAGDAFLDDRVAGLREVLEE